MKTKKYVSVKSIETGKENFYSTYSNAMKKAKSGDSMIVYSDPGGQIRLKDGIRLVFTDGAVVIRTEDEMPLIIFEDGANCSIEGLKIILNKVK